MYLYNASRKQVCLIMCRHTIKSKIKTCLGMRAFHTVSILILHCTLKIAYGKYKIQNIKWFNQKIVTMPIETSEEVIFNR